MFLWHNPPFPDSPPHKCPFESGPSPSSFIRAYWQQGVWVLYNFHPLHFLMCSFTHFFTLSFIYSENIFLNIHYVIDTGLTWPYIRDNKHVNWLSCHVLRLSQVCPDSHGITEKWHRVVVSLKGSGWVGCLTRQSLAGISVTSKISPRVASESRSEG